MSQKKFQERIDALFEILFVQSEKVCKDFFATTEGDSPAETFLVLGLSLGIIEAVIGDSLQPEKDYKEVHKHVLEAYEVITQMKGFERAIETLKHENED